MYNFRNSRIHFTKIIMNDSLYNEADASFVLEEVVFNIGEDLLYVVRESRTQLSGRVVCIRMPLKGHGVCI